MAEKDIVTACLILIGNEILSGRTQDKNLNFLATGLNEIGIQMREARVIPDIRKKIVDTVNECRAEFDYVFTTGGIGPTHDDITSECVAEAFGVSMYRDQSIVDLLNSYMKGRGRSEMNEARMRMATFPEGAVLIKNEVSAAPGYKIGNVFVMAGVPRIMRSMFDEAKVHLEGGKKVQARGLAVDLPEGTIAEPLALVQARFKEVDIGSYPQMRNVGFRVSVVARGTDPDRLDQVIGELMQSLRDMGGNPLEEDLSTAQSQSHVDD
ncbi:MAG: competence/damage-inducible protein A [Rhodospirillaceae bacterium]|nr:MAG: competence/damage-inducible protein A [Rhodospirillaceae bacterium]